MRRRGPRLLLLVALALGLAAEAPAAAAPTGQTVILISIDTLRSDRLPAEGAAVYRVAVGKRHKIGPSAIVGALANEGSLKRSDFGKITIGQDHTLVELPELDRSQLEQLSKTRIMGVPIDIQVDTGARPSRGDRGERGGRGSDERPPRKPRQGRER